jgi:hypothetical protein
VLKRFDSEERLVPIDAVVVGDVFTK